MKNKLSANSGERGQSMVEFAFGAVFLIILLVGIADMARLLYTYMAVREAAEEGALVASMYPDDLGLVRERVRENSNLSSGLNLSDGQILVTFNNASPCTGSLVTVRVNYDDFTLTTPFIGALITSNQHVPIHATVSATVLLPKCQ